VLLGGAFVPKFSPDREIERHLSAHSCGTLRDSGQDDLDHLIRPLGDLLPCEAQDEPSADDESVLPRPVALEGASIRVEGSPVHLDGNAQPKVRKIDLGDHLT